MKNIILINFYILLFSFNGFSQDTIAKHDIGNHHLWFHFGIGKSATKKLNYTNASAGGTYLFKNTVALQYTVQELFRFLNTEYTVDSYSNKIYAIGLNKTWKRSHSLMIFGGLTQGVSLFLGEYIKQNPPSNNTPLYAINLNFDLTPSKVSDFEQTRNNYQGKYLAFQYLYRGRNMGFATLYYIHKHNTTDHGITFLFNLGHLKNQK